MYIKQFICSTYVGSPTNILELWEILDEDEEQICTVIGMENADKLLIILNKN